MTLLLETLTSDLCQASSEGETVNGTPFTNEYMVIIHFVPAKGGRFELPKMSLAKHFVDSDITLKFFAEQAKLAATARGAPTTL